MTSETIAETLAQICPGSVIGGRYTIEGQIGAGGFATVFSAFDREIERQVAIKVLNLAVMASGQNVDVQPFLERFRREARLAARIRHGNVVEIYDFGVLGDGSDPYMVMEMLDGHDLQDEIDDHGGMAPTRALPLFCAALDALGEAHQLGIVHKDLKPANLFINRPGTRHELLKVVDFGIAHIGESNESRMTQTGAMFGTPQYLPPEYIQTQVVSPGMDVYQMGLILVELLTGRSVVDEDNPWQCAVKHVTREINIPVELLDGTLGPILRRALEYEPGDRYANAVLFADALTEIDPASVGDVRSPSTSYRKIDNTSGQFVPTSDLKPSVRARSTDGIKVAALGDTAEMGPGMKTSAEPTPPAQLQGRAELNAETGALEGADDSEGASKRRLALILGLLILLIAGASVVLMQFGDTTSETDQDGLSAPSTATSTPSAEPQPPMNSTNSPGEELGVKPAVDSLQNNIGAQNPNDSEPLKVGVQKKGSPADKPADMAGAKAKKSDPAPKQAPDTVAQEPRKSKPKPKPPKKSKPSRNDAPPKVAAPPKEKPAKRPAMMLVPDPEPDDTSMQLAP